MVSANVQADHESNSRIFEAQIAAGYDTLRVGQGVRRVRV
jgi:hypothetical protein